MQERPLPWGQGRYSLRDYGYSWQFCWLESSRFLQSAVAVRDVGLDLNFTNEITRPTLSFPFPVYLQRDRLLEFEGVRLRVPDRLSAGGYNLIGITNISGLQIPLRSELIAQTHDGMLSFRKSATNFLLTKRRCWYENLACAGKSKE